MHLVQRVEMKRKLSFETLPPKYKRPSNGKMATVEISKLPPELLLHLMTQVETPRDLFALIQTSQQFAQLFRRNRDAVLSAVIKNAFPGQNLRIAFAACKAAETSKLWWKPSSLAVVEESQSRFYEECPRCYAPEKISLRDQALQQSLCKLWSVTSYFQALYEEKSLALTMKVMPFLRQPGSDQRTCESARLQRAFLRFEVYRRLNPATMNRKWELRSQIEPVGFEMPLRTPQSVWHRLFEFLKLFTPWEREELISIQEFLTDYAMDIYSKLRNFLDSEIRSIAQDAMEKVCAPGRPQEFEPISRIAAILDLGGYDVFETAQGPFEQRFSYLVARGLPFLKWLSDLPPRDGIAAAQRHSLADCAPSLFDALGSLRRNMTATELASFDTGADWRDEFGAEPASPPNRGWLWADGHGLTVGYRSLLKRYVLRKMGYVFWDEAKLNGDWKLELTDPSLLNLPERDENDPRSSFGQGAKKQFQDLKAPKGAFAEEEVEPRLNASEAMLEMINGGFPNPFSEEEARKLSIEY